MSQEFIYHMKGLVKRTPNGKEILKNIWLSYFHGAKIGVVGPNGAGKSTLLRIMAGLDTQFDGEAWCDPEARVGYLPQEPKLDPALDVRGNIELGVKPIRDLLSRYEAVNMAFAEPDADIDALIMEQAELQERIEASDAWDLDRRVEIAMDALRTPPGESAVDTLSGGEQRRVALCQLLLSQPDLLLLDEPTNHLDVETVAWLERTLREYKGTVLVVTHDRYFLDNVTEWILELDAGQGVPFKGNYSSWIAQKLDRLRTEGKIDSAKATALARELAWIGTRHEDRRTQSDARLIDYQRRLEELESEGQGRKRVDIAIPPGPRLGDLVVEVEGLEMSYGDQLLFDDLSFSLPRGGLVGIIGPNGAGKTTLFRLLLGLERPEGGAIRCGDTVVMATAGQMRDELDDSQTVFEALSLGREVISVGAREINARAYVSAFGFKGAQQQQPLSTLSGGERNRAYLAAVLQKGANVLLLDEPTNDLDVSTLRELEEALLAFPGCAAVISHDRWFLDRIATHILAFEGGSRVVWSVGNYHDYEADRRKRLGTEADRPRRIRYKPVTR